MVYKEFSVSSGDLENETLKPVFLFTISKPLRALTVLVYHKGGKFKCCVGGSITR